MAKRSGGVSGKRTLVRRICRKLQRHFGPPAAPRCLDPLGELVFTILSQNTTDRNTEAAYRSLLERFRTWDRVASAPTDAVAEAIRTAGLANQKAPRVQAAVRWMLDQFQGDPWRLCELPVEEAIRQLRSLPGIGPKTAACVLLFCCRKPVLPVDTHVHRVARRLGLLPERCSTEQAHELLGSMVPDELILGFHVHLIALGRTICRAQRPLCPQCPLYELCPTGQKRSRGGRKR